jgi:DNA-binding CsgD family transcriptional regulator
MGDFSCKINLEERSFATKYHGGEKMPLFEQFKKLIAFGHPTNDEKNIADSQEMVGSNNHPSFESPLGITGEEQRERFFRLTPREHELCLLLLEGYTLKESAHRLSVKYSTANTHMTGIYKKLGVKSRAELIIKYRGVLGKDSGVP